jgi:hypothetical protein
MEYLYVRVVYKSTQKDNEEAETNSLVGAYRLAVRENGAVEPL